MLFATQPCRLGDHATVLPLTFMRYPENDFALSGSVPYDASVYMTAVSLTADRDNDGAVISSLKLMVPCIYLSTCKASDSCSFDVGVVGAQHASRIRQVWTGDDSEEIDRSHD